MEDFSYRNPQRTALEAVEALANEWPEYTEDIREPIRAVLASFVAAVNAAQSDIERGTRLVEFLPRLEALPELPAPVRQILRDDHRPKLTKIEKLYSEDARKLLALIKAMETAEAAEEAGGPTAKTPAAVADEEPDTRRAGQRFEEAAIKTERVVELLNREFSQLSLPAQDDVAGLLRELDWRLQQAGNDQAREEVAQWFLAAIVEHPEASRRVDHIVGPKRSTKDVAGMSSELAQRIQGAVAQNPAVYPAQEAHEAVMEDMPPLPAMPGPDTEVLDTQEVSPPSTQVELHTKVDFPAEVSIFEEAVPLVVQLTIEKPEVSVAHGTGKFTIADAAEPEQVVVVVAAEGFEEVTGEVSRIIEIYAQRDSQPAVFLLRPVDVGPQLITISFYHRERMACTVKFETEIKDRPPVTAKSARLAPLISEGEDGATDGDIAVPFSRSSEASTPPDLELRITTGAQRTRLTFMLRSSSGRYASRRWTPMGTIDLAEEPRRYVEGLQADLNRMARKRGDQLSADQARSQRRQMAGMGQNLYLRLFPPRLKEAYCAISEAMHKEQEKDPKRGKLSLLISSDEPWIPWEIVKPHELEEGTGQVLVDDDFLCAEFVVTRWLAGRGLAEAVAVNGARLVAPQSDLPSVQQERQYFEVRLAEQAVPFRAPVIQSREDVLAALEDASTNLYHFACHGEYFDQNPDESMLLLQNKEPFAPSHVIGDVRTGVARSKPLVFLNACHSGEAGFALTGLGGWAERFLNAGASAFVGTLWQVNDSLAAEFAIKFYDELWQGRNLGTAFYSARMHIRKLDDTNPTWLAYTLYADPNGRVERAAN